MSTQTEATIEIAKLRTDGGTQTRAKLSTDVVRDYAEAIRSGVTFPAVVAFHDGTDYWLADGFHRVEARKLAEFTDVAVDVRPGGQRDAVLFSAGANADHGLPRTNADKRRAVMTLLKDAEWSQWSDREIARRCMVGNKFVGDVRASLCSGHSEPAGRTYTTKHGSTASMKTDRIGRRGPVRGSPAKAAEHKPLTQDEIDAQRERLDAEDPLLAAHRKPQNEGGGAGKTKAKRGRVETATDRREPATTSSRERQPKQLPKQLSAAQERCDKAIRDLHSLTDKPYMEYSKILIKKVAEEVLAAWEAITRTSGRAKAGAAEPDAQLF